MRENAVGASSVASLPAYEPADTREPVLDIAIGNAMEYGPLARTPVLLEATLVGVLSADFLGSDFRTTAALGTRRLTVALREAAARPAG